MSDRQYLSIYIAGSTRARHRLRAVRDLLVSLGHTVTSRWLNDAESDGDDNLSPARALRVAMRDIEDIDRADSLILDTSVEPQRAGREVELGYFIGKTGPVMASIVGPKRNVFHELVGAHFDTWEDCLKAYAVHHN